MSRFRSDVIVKDSHPSETVADGVTIERRTMLRISAATVAAAFTFISCGTSTEKREVAGKGRAQPAPDGVLEIGDLFSEMYPRARRFIDSGGINEEAYLMQVGALLANLRIPSEEQLEAASEESFKKHGAGRSAETLDIAIVMFNFEAGKGFKHHDHRDYNGMILGVEGEVAVKNFDILGGNPVPPEGQTFQIRQTRDDIILPGRFSSLGLARDNVHEVVAGPSGAKVVDAFTFLKPDANSYFMEVDPKPRDTKRGVFDAAWR